MYVQDFATSSMRGEVAIVNEEWDDMGVLEKYTIAERKALMGEEVR